MRFEAMTRRPASSSILVTAPVRLRRVASGLMIEKVRVTTMAGRTPVLGWSEVAGGPSGRAPERQGSGLVDPFAALLRPITPLHFLAPGQQLPREPRAVERIAIEQ